MISLNNEYNYSYPRQRIQKGQPSVFWLNMLLQIIPDSPFVDCQCKLETFFLLTQLIGHTYLWSNNCSCSSSSKGGNLPYFVGLWVKYYVKKVFNQVDPLYISYRRKYIIITFYMISLIKIQTPHNFRQIDKRHLYFCIN